MNIPKRYQIFERPVVITDKDEERLRPYLSSWNRVIECLLRGASPTDVERLIIMELIGSGRPAILNKLLVRHGKNQRQLLQRKIDLC
jgi:hypothetical protein